MSFQECNKKPPFWQAAVSFLQEFKRVQKNPLLHDDHRFGPTMFIYPCLGLELLNSGKEFEAVQQAQALGSLNESTWKLGGSCDDNNDGYDDDDMDDDDDDGDDGDDEDDDMDNDDVNYNDYDDNDNVNHDNNDDLASPRGYWPH